MVLEPLATIDSWWTLFMQRRARMPVGDCGGTLLYRRCNRCARCVINRCAPQGNSSSKTNCDDDRTGKVAMDHIKIFAAILVAFLAILASSGAAKPRGWTADNFPNPARQPDACNRTG